MPKLLEYLKENDINHEDVIKLIETKKGKPDLKTREELEAELKKAQAKLKEETEEEEEEEEEEDDDTEEESPESKKFTDTLKKMNEKIAALEKTAITRKKTKPAKKLTEDEVPDDITVTIKKNMFETMV